MQIKLPGQSFTRLTVLLLTAMFALSAHAAKGKDESSPPDGQPNAVFDQPIAKVQEQAVNALVVLGCELKKQLPNYLEGKRTRKVGVFVGSGGETLRVWLSETEGKTAIKVSTDKTFVGGAGQKNWDKQMVEEITKGLATAAPAEAAPEAAASGETPASAPASSEPST